MLSLAGECLSCSLLPAKPQWPPHQPWRIPQNLDPQYIPVEPHLCFWGRCQQSKIRRSDLWSSFCLSVSHPLFSFWLFLGLRSGLTQKIICRWFCFCLVYKHARTFVLINKCKIILGKHSIFSPRHLYPTNNKKLGRKMRICSAIGGKKTTHHLKLCY